MLLFSSYHFSSLSSALSSPSLSVFLHCFYFCCFSHVPPCDPFLTLPVFYSSLSSFPILLTSPPHFLRLSTDCQFEIGGWDGIIRSSQVEEEERVKPGDALDCIWTIRAPPQSKVSTRDRISDQEGWHALLLFYFQPMFGAFRILRFKIATIGSGLCFCLDDSYSKLF